MRAILLFKENKQLISASKDKSVRIWSLKFVESYRKLNSVLENKDFETAK